MNAEVRFALQALNDLQGIADFIAPRGGEQTARDFVAKIYAYCLSFETFPERGVARDDLRPGLRLIGYQRRATIAFSFRDGTVTILRIMGRGLDVEMALSSELPPSSS